jgi:hypothetical protein
MEYYNPNIQIHENVIKDVFLKNEMGVQKYIFNDNA